MENDKTITMQRIDAILQNEQFQYGLKRINLLEQDRIFCCHGLNHLLDVARIAWIMVLERNLPVQKDIVYGAALLHDLGRYRQYEDNIPHHLLGLVLPGVGYTKQTPSIVKVDGARCLYLKMTAVL